jgi:hypothetical protein
MSVRREPSGVLVTIRCGWGSCRYRLGEVYPIRPRIEGDPAGMLVTLVKDERRRIESLVPTDFSGTVQIASCPHDHNALRRRAIGAVPGGGKWSPTSELSCAQLKFPIERARITGHAQVLRVK